MVPFVGEQSLCTLCVHCALSDTVHFMQFTGLACPYKYGRLGALDCTYNDHQDHQNTAPTWNGDLNLSKWGSNGDLILSEMGTKWGPLAAEMGTEWGINGYLNSVYFIN